MKPAALAGRDCLKSSILVFCFPKRFRKIDAEKNTHSVASDNLPCRHVNQHHVACFEQSKVSANGIHPESLRVFWISNAYVSRHSLDESLSCEISKRRRHMVKLPLSLFFGRLKQWNAYLALVLIRHPACRGESYLTKERARVISAGAHNSQ